MYQARESPVGGFCTQGAMGCGESRPVKDMTAEEYLAQARTGDIVLFSSDGDEARLVKTFTSSRFSHIGMVVRTERPLSWVSQTSGVYLWHAPSDSVTGLPDLMSDPPARKGGPQLNDLADALHVFRRIKGIEVRRLKPVEGSRHAWARGVVTERSQLISYLRQEHVKQYETSVAQLVKSVVDSVPGFENKEDTSEYFCSELVAATMKRFNVMKTEVPSNEFTPKDFGSSNDYSLGLSGEFRLRREIRVVAA